MKNELKNNEILRLNIKEYNKKYKKGYGIKYPEGHVIRHSKYFKNKKSILDFGCGSKTHMEFFFNLGIKKIYGVDTANMINKIKSKKFKLFKIGPNEDLTKLIKNKLDVIFANQVLYYLDDKTLNFYLKQFNYLLKKNGLLYSTWLAPKHYYYYNSKKLKGTNMRKLTFNSRLKETTYINFKKIKNIERLLIKNKFKTLHFGHYDIIMNYNEVDSGGAHYLNLSKKT